MKSIKISEEVYELILTIARRKGKSIEEVILECIIDDLDPDMRVNVYVKLHGKYLKEAEEFYTKGNLVQASEKYWSAVTALINAIGEKRG